MIMEILDLNFSGLSTAEFIFKVTHISDKLDVHPFFNAYPEHVAGPDRLREIVEQLKKLNDAASNRDVVKVAEMKAFRAEAEQQTAITGLHLIMVAIFKKDLSLLHNTGFDRKQHRTYTKSQTSSTSAAPKKISAKNGFDPGTVTIMVSRPQGVASIELWYTNGDPTDESSWKSLRDQLQCRIELKGLESVSRYHFKARYRNGDATSPWSATIPLIVH
jgi:hypothetical protein